jgi:hypothetical protein
VTVEAKRRVEGLSQGCCAVFNQSDWALAGFSVSDFETTGSVLVHSQKEKVSRIDHVYVGTGINKGTTTPPPMESQQTGS